MKTTLVSNDDDARVRNECGDKKEEKDEKKPVIFWCATKRYFIDERRKCCLSTSDVNYSYNGRGNVP